MSSNPWKMFEDDADSTIVYDFDNMVFYTEKDIIAVFEKQKRLILFGNLMINLCLFLRKNGI